MPNGASIVVDIKAQITGYQELIEKIKAELKKIDPGSNIGKGLNKTLALAETKLALLSRNTEKRITSEGLLEHLFDLLHMVNDLMRNLGQGMSNVGLNDVLETASEKARELGNSLREVKTEMAQKGNTFFEDLKKTNPKELLAVFDELKFDPKTMGIDTFVESFKLATESAKTEVEDLKNKQREAQAELERTSSMKARRDLLPVALLGTKVAQEAIRNTFGARNNLDAAKIVSDRDAEILTFVDKIKAGIESDTTRSDANKENAVNALSESITKLLDAKTDELVKKILSDLDKALKSTKGEDKGGSHSGIKGLSGESLNTELILKLSLTTYLADQDFVNKIQEVVKLLNDSSNSGANGAGARISEILNALLLPTDVATFNDNMNALIRSLLEGLLKVNKASGDFDTTAKSNVVKTTEEALEAAKLRASNLETVAKSLAYTNLEQEYRALSQRLSEIELALGLERNNNRAGVASDIKNTGKGVLDSAAKANNDAINSLKEYGSMLEDVLTRLQMVGKVEGIAQRWFSVYAAVRMVSKAFLSMKLTITNLDKTITEIAIVTDMSLSDLWKLMPEYTKIARKYGASLEGVYLVSQLYYQLGLEQADVMALTEETLKMARISGLGYSEATDYMTNAIRSFKIEMQDAGRVVDVYSALAATSASSTTELATAMSKTASSAAAVGSSFEATASMMAVMIETTRESPENIGSALKSIISRYGELKENKTGIDEEGEEYSLNKVDTALLSVGISIHDAQGQFRDFDDTIMELAKSWDTIDTNTLRYIATVMAGNRQQSRFLALVSNGARLAEEMEVANNSEDAATLLMLKTMDSIDYKSQLLLTSLLSLYTSTGIENLFKGILNGANLIVETFTLMPTVFLLPIPAITSLATNFISMANIVMTTIRVLKQKFMAQLAIDNATLRALNLTLGKDEIANTAATEEAEVKIVQLGAAKRRSILAGELSGLTKMNPKSKVALGAQLAGTVLNLGAGLISDKGAGNRGLKAGLGISGSILLYGALGFLLGGGKGAAIGAILGGLMGVWLNISYIWESTAAQAKRLKEEAEEAATDAKIKLSLANSAEKEIANLKKLEVERHKSAEANKKYIEAANKVAEDIPELVSYYDSEGNAILDLSNAYAILAAKRKEANDAAVVASSTSIQAAEKSVQEKSEVAKDAVSTQLSKILDDDNFKGVVKEKWLELEKLAPNFDFGHGLQLFNVKWGSAALSDIVGYADNNTFTNTPELMKLRKMLSTGDVKGISNILNNPNQRKIQFNLWESELNNLTDPFSKALMDFVLAQLQTVSAEVVDTLGDLSLSKAVYKSEIHSAAVTKISNFLSEQLLLADYGELGDPKAEFAKNTLLRFKDFNSSNEIAVNYLESAYINGLNKTWKNWEEFEQILNDPELSPLLEVIEILADIPQTSLDKLNELYTNKSNLTQVEFTNLLMSLIPEQTQKFYDLLSIYYLNAFKEWDTVLSSESWNNYELRPLISSKTKDEFGPEELRRILNQYEGLNKLYNQGKITYTDVNQISTNYSSILRYSATLNDNNKEIVQNILTNTEFTLESLTDAINQILNNTDLTEGEKLTIIPKLTAILSAIPVNINTTIETYLDEYAEKTENLSKDLSKATKGMTQKDALKMADDLKIDTSTKYFDVKKGKLFLKDTNLLYNSYFGEDSSLSKLNEKIGKLKEELKKIKDPTKLTESTFDHISANEVTSINNAWTDWSKTNGDNWQAFIEYYFTGRINEVKLLSENLMNSIRMESAIDNGDLEEIIKAAAMGAAKDIPKSLTALLLQSLQSGDFTNLITNSNLSQEFKEQLPVMKDAYDQANSTILTSLTNNIGAGIEYIEANDYNRNLLSDMAKSGLAELNKDASGEIIGATINNTIDDIDTIYDFIKNYTTPDGFDKTEILAKLKLQQYTTRTKSGTLAEIVKNTDAISATAVESFKAVWGDTAEIRALFQDNGNGTYKATENLLVWIQNHLEELNDSANAAALEMLALIFDNNLSSIKNAVSYVTSGAKNLSEIEKLITTAKNVGVTIDQSNFSFDAIANAWTLNPAKMLEFVRALGRALINAGLMTLKQFGEYLKVNVTLTLASAVDIDSFLLTENRGELSLARAQLSKQLDSLLGAIAITPYETIINEVEDEWLTTHEAITQEDQKEIDQKVKELWEKEIKAKQEYAQLRDMSNEEIITDLENGGARAVELAQLIAKASGKELSLEQIDSYYYAQINRLLSFSDSIANLTKGSYVAEGEFRTILLGVGMVDSNGVVTSVEKAAAAYKEIYDRMSKTGEQTASSLNKVYALYLTETERGDIDAIEVMGNAMGMTYDALGTLLGRYGKELETWLRQNTGLYEKIGAGKIRITDFSQFASSMGWRPGSEEYTSAFKTYNDSLIELNNKTEKSIFDEIKNISDANIGDLINLTQAYTAIEKFERHDMQDFVYSLRDLGAEFSDGILTLSDNANIPMIIKAIAEEALKAGGLIPELLASLNDVLIETLSKIANLIKSGISGTLSNVDAHNLSGWAESVGIDKLNFVKTTDGLKLALDSAIELYTKLNLIDSLQGKLVFDELNKSLQESNEHYKSISDIANRIAWIEDETHPERAKLYALELALAKEILAVRSTTEDSSFSFMSNKIPGGLNNPLNYWKNWGDAWKTLEESSKSGTMDYTAFYNIITEMGNLAEKSGAITVGAGTVLNNSLDAANLIEAAAASLRVDANGALTVDLSNLANLGFNFEAAGADMSKGVEAGIKEMAQSLVDMLDSMIQLMETIVAMELLGDLDVDGNGLNIGDLFNITYDEDGSIKSWDKEFKGAYKDFREEMLRQLKLKKGDEGFNEDLLNGLTLTLIGNGENKFSLADLLNWTPDDFMQEGHEEIAKIYPAILQAYSDAARSGNYSLDNIWSSIKEVLAGNTAGFEGDIDIGDLHLTVSQGIILERDKDGNFIVDGKSYTTAEAAIQALQTSTLGEFINATKETNPETGETTYTAGTLKATIVYNAESKTYHINFSDGTFADAPDETSAKFALKAWALMNGTDLSEVEDGKEVSNLSFTYHAKAGVVMDIEADITTGEITYTNKTNISGIELAKAILDVATSLKLVTVPIKAEGLEASGEQTISIGIEGDDVVNEALENILKKLEELKEQADISITISDDTAGALASLNASLNDLNADPITKEIKAVIIDYTNSSNANPNKLVNNLQGILTNYENQIPEELKKAIEGLIGIITLAQADPNITLPEIKDLVTNLTLGTNEPADALNSNTQKAQKELILNIKLKTNETGTALLDNLKVEDVNLDIINTTNDVIATIDANVKYAKDHPAKLSVESEGGSSGGHGFAKGNVNFNGIAKATGTLMGELGPELVVSNGRYFVAGQNGPEMVDLADDAIVFNHLQTKSLLEKGTSQGRGKAITNECNAVAFATGNINGGPAMASASAALAALRLLRAEWNAIAQLSVQDLAGKGGGGGGGGGSDSKSFIKDLERWYNWLQQIALLEKEINLEEAKRSRYLSSMVSMGREYADSQLVTLDKLKQEVAILHSLNESKGAFFEKRRTELNEESAFKALYRFDENGQLKYKPGQFEWLSDLVGRDSVTGEANYTAKEQYERLVAAGYGEQMKYDASGNEIKQEGDDWYVTAIQAFWDKIEAEREEMQSLHDDVLEGQVKEEELMTNLNEILNAIEDNLIAVEDKVLKAVEETRLREIDAIQDEKDAIEKSSQALITGLSDLLSKEQDMYSRQQDSNELSRLQRLLSILQRSGGSASLIASLQKDITERLLDAYFDALKAQIDALLEASDNQLQKLQEQIDLMTELLAYEKEHGMLWEQVYQVMALSPELITEFITKNTEEYWGKSPADFAEDSREVLFQAEQFVLMRENVEGGLATLVAANSPEAIAAESEKITAESETQLTPAESTTLTNTNTTSTTDTSGSGNNSDITGYYYKSAGAQGHYLIAMMADGSLLLKSGLQEHTFSGNKCTKCYYEREGEGGSTVHDVKMHNTHFNTFATRLASGGLITKPTYSLVGETGKPEAVLNPEQTSILRNDILSNKPTSLLSLLTDFRDAYENLSGISTYNTTNNDGVVIQQATVEMNVSRIANDYDAQRAGEQALDQMLAIARRTQAQNRVGR